MPFANLNSTHLRSASAHLNEPSVGSFTARGAAFFKVSEEQFSNWRWQMKHQVQTTKDIEGILPLFESEKLAFKELGDQFQVGITPYYIALMNEADEFDPVRLQALPRMEEAKDILGVADPLLEVTNSPVKEVVHVYEDRVAFCVAQLCPVYCRYCFRKRRDEEEGLHFNPKIIKAGIEYIASNPKIRDVLITGGDPLIAQDGSLESLLAALRNIPHVEIIRIGTRVPVTLPYRITEELGAMLAKYHPVWINTHFNCVEELTPEAACAIDTLLRNGIPVGNQSVLLKDINDSVEKMQDLVRGLVKMRVRPYYLYQAQIVSGTEHLRVPIEQGLDIMRALRGRVTGFSIPQYVIDTPYGKIPLSPNHIRGRQGDKVMLETYSGKVWADPNPLSGYEPKTSLNEVHLNEFQSL